MATADSETAQTDNHPTADVSFDNIRTITSVYWSVGWFDVSKWFYWSMWRDTVALLVIVLISTTVATRWLSQSRPGSKTSRR